MYVDAAGADGQIRSGPRGGHGSAGPPRPGRLHGGHDNTARPATASTTELRCAPAQRVRVRPAHVEHGLGSAVCVCVWLDGGRRTAARHKTRPDSRRGHDEQGGREGRARRPAYLQGSAPATRPRSQAAVAVQQQGVGAVHTVHTHPRRRAGRRANQRRLPLLEEGPASRELFPTGRNAPPNRRHRRTADLAPCYDTVLPHTQTPRRRAHGQVPRRRWWTETKERGGGRGVKPALHCTALRCVPTLPPTSAVFFSAGVSSEPKRRRPASLSAAPTTRDWRSLPALALAPSAQQPDGIAKVACDSPGIFPAGIGQVLRIRPR